MEILVDDKLLERFSRIDEIIANIEEGLDEDTSSEFVDDISLELFDKQSIMVLLKCESDKALRFLKLMYQMKYAVKIGNQYYVKKDDFERFFDDFKGRAVAI